MHYLITAPSFFPCRGGIETHTDLLARDLLRRGHRVSVLTLVLGVEEEVLPYQVYRRGRIRDIFSLFQSADRVIQNHPSIQLNWPLVFLQKPLFTFHHTWLCDGGFYSQITSILKRYFASSGVGFANSSVISRDSGRECEVVGNPYDDEIFYIDSKIARQESVVIVSRLVSDKGVDFALRVFGRLSRKGVRIPVRIVGEGPDRLILEQIVQEERLQDQVEFLGRREGKELAKILNQNLFCLIPSRWEEPFGIVALEALACGCRVIYSCTGGLSEAVGSWGEGFQKENSTDCSRAIEVAIRKGFWSPLEQSQIQDHLKVFRRENYFNRIYSIFNFEDMMKS